MVNVLSNVTNLVSQIHVRICHICECKIKQVVLAVVGLALGNTYGQCGTSSWMLVPKEPNEKDGDQDLHLRERNVA